MDLREETAEDAAANADFIEWCWSSGNWPPPPRLYRVDRQIVLSELSLVEGAAPAPEDGILELPDSPAFDQDSPATTTPHPNLWAASPNHVRPFVFRMAEVEAAPTSGGRLGDGAQGDFDPAVIGHTEGSSPTETAPSRAAGGASGSDPDAAQASTAGA